jgi:2-dehydro-3-deoxyphosphogluconate aldolase / (4S)-4-hydroxy-2-oxoglutarate aldolase
MNVVAQLEAAGVVAVARLEDAETALAVTGALVAGGLKAIEFTFTTQGVLGVMEKAVARYGKELLIGAGTVLDPETARAAILAGARFVVTPAVRPDVITMCRRYGITVAVGALTPSEILTAWEAGADIVKVFPASAFGPKYLKDVKGPLPQVRLMPTGGVDLANLGDYLKAGAVAVGVGGNLVKGTPAEVEARTREYVAAVAAARGGSR